MALRGTSQALGIQPVTDGGRDSIERAGQRQVDAVYSAVGEGTSTEPFITGPPHRRSDLRALGIGRNVDIYA